MGTTIRNYTAEEKDALREKLYNPDKPIKCPRCGKDIAYKEIGNSTSVKCHTEGCIKGGLRGL